MKKYIYLIATIIITSSCNTDDVITEKLEDHYRAKTETSVAEQTVVFDTPLLRGSSSTKPRREVLPVKKPLPKQQLHTPPNE